MVAIAFLPERSLLNLLGGGEHECLQCQDYRFMFRSHWSNHVSFIDKAGSAGFRYARKFPRWGGQTSPKSQNGRNAIMFSYATTSGHCSRYGSTCMIAIGRSGGPSWPWVVLHIHAVAFRFVEPTSFASYEKHRLAIPLLNSLPHHQQRRHNLMEAKGEVLLHSARFFCASSCSCSRVVWSCNMSHQLAQTQVLVYSDLVASFIRNSSLQRPP